MAVAWDMDAMIIIYAACHQALPGDRTSRECLVSLRNALTRKQRLLAHDGVGILERALDDVARGWADQRS
jgi:hypothetical protein